MLNREPMGMKPFVLTTAGSGFGSFSAQPRADGDEAPSIPIISVKTECFSAQPRADGDEADAARRTDAGGEVFQCSTASRWG